MISGLLLKAQNTSDQKLEVFSLFLEAQVLYETASFEKSLNNYAKVLQWETRYTALHFYALINTANIHLNHTKKKKKAISYYKRAYALLPDVLCEERQLLVLSGLAYALLFDKQYEESERYYKQVLRIFMKNEDLRNVAMTYSNLGNLFFEQYKDEQAEDYFLKALNVIENTNDIRVKQQIYYNLYAVNHENGRYGEALDHLIRSNTLKDSIWNRDKVWELAEKDKQFAIANKEGEVKIQRQQKLTLLVVFTLVLFLIVVLFYIYRIKERQKQLLKEQNYQKQLLENSIEIQEKERRRVAADIHDGLIGKLRALQLTCNDEVQAKGMQNCIATARDISHDLYPPLIEEIALDELIDSYLLAFRSLYDIKFWSVNSRKLAVPPNIKLTVYRIFQELITNVKKHARCDKITVYLRVTNQHIQMLVGDDGLGLSEKVIGGLGLKNIELRVNQLNARSKFTKNHPRGVKFVFSCSI